MPSSAWFICRVATGSAGTEFLPTRAQARPAPRRAASPAERQCCRAYARSPYRTAPRRKRLTMARRVTEPNRETSRLAGVELLWVIVLTPDTGDSREPA